MGQKQRWDLGNVKKKPNVKRFPASVSAHVQIQRLVVLPEVYLDITCV